MELLRQIQQEMGAILDSETQIPLSFGNDERALIAAKEEVVLCDRSNWGLLKLTGEDRLRYLHNQSTNNFNQLQPGQGCDTVFVTSTARTLDLATAYVTEDAVLVLVSPQRRQQLLEWLDRFIFPFDKVELSDISTEYAVFNLIGKQSDDFLTKLGLQSVINQPENSHQLVNFDNNIIRIAIGNGLALPGYTLIIPVAEAAACWSKLITIGVTPIGDRVWSQLRILQGRPIPDQELTEDYNPLEAGLWHAISFEKGCYIGQETIARLNTYKGVKQQLWGIKLTAPVNPGTLLILEGNKVGILTSCTNTSEGNFGLAYLRTKAGGIGLQVQVEDAKGEIIALPCLTHEYYS
ncbi:folate-binding protein YgfZ [Stanieria cyanosphaera PCC 7437]|uniref:Folate-binding protein YgfZ n=1 Tax=Stanieria cyanosphaera (strain ATCC 29371 / PCC 7437) TaxID=111780 RepID=K9XNW2_STAC7|nr:folate-binding protein YgfZ [Stanieria cyanosphaera]AFZ34300.1 folate-binding protein YgfZ [Stanieria cyanosphaera PCC 7437]